MEANLARRAEISEKLLVMGQALMKEGANIQDYTITQSGTMMILLGSLLLDDNDMFIFTELCAMFSAKKILDASEGVNPLEQQMFAKILKERAKKASEKKTPTKASDKKTTRRKPKGPPDAEGRL